VRESEKSHLRQKREKKRTHAQVMFAASFCSLQRLLSLGVSYSYKIYVKLEHRKIDTRKRGNSVQNLVKETNYFQLMQRKKIEEEHHHHHH